VYDLQCASFAVDHVVCLICIKQEGAQRECILMCVKFEPLDKIFIVLHMMLSSCLSTVTLPAPNETKSKRTNWDSKITITVQHYTLFLNLNFLGVN